MRSSVPARIAISALLTIYAPLSPLPALAQGDDDARIRAVQGPSTTAEIPVPGLRRLFKAGFEEPVVIEKDYSGRRAWLRGVDAYGDSWEALNHVFELVAPNAFSNLVTIRFSGEKRYSGERSLFLRQDKMQDGAQARLQFFSDDKSFGNEVFTRREYFIPSTNLAFLATEEASVSIAGTRETRGGGGAGEIRADFSMPLFVVRKGSQLVFAQAIVDYSAGPKWSDWTRAPRGLVTYGKMTACPLDRWFRLDIYVVRDQTQGAIKVWVDNNVVFDLENVRTKNDTDAWFTRLADVDSEPAPFELWVDDVEIWSR